MAHAFVDCDDYQNFEHFVLVETCHGEGFVMASSDMDDRHYDCRNNFICMHM